MDRALVESMQREIDGENSPAESAQLHAVIGSDPEAATEYHLLSMLDRRLSVQPLEEPPRQLKQNILDALPERPRVRTEVRLPYFLSDLWDGLTARPAFAYAYVFAAGLILGIAAYAVILDDPLRSSDRPYGTLVEDRARGFSEETRLPISVPGMEGVIDVFARGDMLMVDLSVTSSEPTEIMLTAEPTGVLRGVESTGSHAFPVVTDGRIQLTVGGEEAMAATFQRPADGALRLKIEVRRDERLLLEETLTL